MDKEKEKIDIYVYKRKTNSIKLIIVKSLIGFNWKKINVTSKPNHKAWFLFSSIHMQVTSSNAW